MLEAKCSPSRGRPRSRFNERRVARVVVQWKAQEVGKEDMYLLGTVEDRSTDSLLHRCVLAMM
jgi:hypothetical protein